MISGIVTSDREAVVRTSISNNSGNGSSDQQLVVTVLAAVDTGFSGYITLPLEIVSSLELQFDRSSDVILGDGSVATMDQYAGYVLRHDSWREVKVYAAQATPLIGISLLYSSRLAMDVVDGGSVVIEPL